MVVMGHFTDRRQIVEGLLSSCQIYIDRLGFLVRGIFLALDFFVLFFLPGRMDRQVGLSFLRLLLLAFDEFSHSDAEHFILLAHADEEAEAHQDEHSEDASEDDEADLVRVIFSFDHRGLRVDC